MTIQTNAPRRLRSFLTRQVRTGAKTLFLLTPQQTGKNWRFAVPYQDRLVTIGKPVESEDQGNQESVNRWGQQAQAFSLYKILTTYSQPEGPNHEEVSNPT